MTEALQEFASRVIEELEKQLPNFPHRPDTLDAMRCMVKALREASKGLR